MFISVRRRRSSSGSNSKALLGGVLLALLALAVTACDEEKGKAPVNWLRKHYQSAELPDGWTIDSVAMTQNRVFVLLDLPQDAGAMGAAQLRNQMLRACPVKTARVWDFLKPNQGVTIKGRSSSLAEPVEIYCPGPV